MPRAGRHRWSRSGGQVETTIFLEPELQEKFDREGRLSLEGYPELPPEKADEEEQEANAVAKLGPPTTRKEMHKEQKRRKREISWKRFEDAQ